MGKKNDKGGRKEAAVPHPVKRKKKESQKPMGDLGTNAGSLHPPTPAFRAIFAPENSLGGLPPT